MSIFILKKIEGSLVIAANLYGQKAVPFWPRERLEAVRNRRIRSIVQHAAKTQHACGRQALAIEVEQRKTVHHGRLK